MTGINALSTRGVIKGLDDGASSSVNAQAGTDSAAMMFAAIFGGWLNQVGQGQDSGNQSNEPAGKEANSGRHALLGLDGLQGLMGMLQGDGDLQEAFLQGLQRTQDSQALQGQGEQATNPEQLEKLLTQLENLSSQRTPSNPLGILEDVQLSGMTGQPQGKDSPQSELDLYKNVISNLLKEMSGEINLKEFRELSQQKSEIVAQRYNSGLFIATDGEGQALEANSATVEGPGVNPSMNQTIAQAGITAEALQGTILVNQAGKSKFGLNEPQLDANPVSTDQTDVDNTLEGNVKSFRAVNGDQETSENIELQKNENSNNPALANNVLGKLAERGVPSTKGVKTKGLQESDNAGESSKVDYVSTDFTREVSGSAQAKDISQIQVKISDKSDQPVWTQIAQEIFDKAYQARPQLREMTIQLHPAELGEINISMSWDEGQVHLRMVASDAGTGQMLQANFSELRDNLNQLGIQCGQMEMGLGDQKDGSQNHQRQEGSTRSQENRKDSLDFLNDDELQRIILSEDNGLGTNRINVRA